jgi:carboxyl-terminal processing protease
MLLPNARFKIISRIKKRVLKHHFNMENIDLNEWCKEVDERTPTLVGAIDDKIFENGIHSLLAELKSSHTDFYRQGRTPTRPEHTIGATIRCISRLDEQQWMFLDVFEESPAARAGITPGNLLISVDRTPAIPPAIPVFRFGEKHELTIGLPNNLETREIAVMLPHRKSTRPRLPFVEPKSVSFKMLTKQVGIVKVAFFSGMVGICFSKALDAAIDSLKAQGCDRLIIDLRGCLGGSLGFARLASYLCPDRRPIGYDITRKRQQQGYHPAKLPRVRMPDTRLGVLFRLAQFSLRDKSLVLLTQGLGDQPFHGRIAMLINESTSSAGEIVAQFAKDTKLATLIGKKTAGLVLGSTMFNVGSGYTLYLPVFGWFTPGGNHTEGSGVVPDLAIDIDPNSLAEGTDMQLNKALEVLQ